MQSNLLRMQAVLDMSLLRRQESCLEVQTREWTAKGSNIACVRTLGCGGLRAPALETRRRCGECLPTNHSRNESQSLLIAVCSASQLAVTDVRTSQQNEPSAATMPALQRRGMGTHRRAPLCRAAGSLCWGGRKVIPAKEAGQRTEQLARQTVWLLHCLCSGACQADHQRYSTGILSRTLAGRRRRQDMPVMGTSVAACTHQMAGMQM